MDRCSSFVFIILGARVKVHEVSLIMPRDSRSRSVRRQRARRDTHHGTGQRRSSLRSRSPRAHSRSDHGWSSRCTSVVDLPSQWNSTSSHLDTALVYGLSRPRQTESTPWSRKQGLMGQAIEAIRLIDVIPFEVRLISNGRYTAFEWFRNRLDALAASSLMKEIHQKRDEFDLNKVVAQFASEGHDTNEWDHKCKAV